MALTTETQQKITDHTYLPGSPRKRTVEADILFDKSVVARPLNAPEVASIHVKNTECYYRWVNRLHSNGRVYMERKAMGFTNATVDDVDVLVGDTVSSDTEIRCGDVILMKIPFHLWAAHVKRNMETAQVLQRMKGITTRDEDLSPDVFAGKDSGIASGDDLDTISRELKGKVAQFTPRDADAIIDGAKSEDTAKAREEVAELRRKHAAERSKKE